MSATQKLEIIEAFLDDHKTPNKVLAEWMDEHPGVKILGMVPTMTQYNIVVRHGEVLGNRLHYSLTIHYEEPVSVPDEAKFPLDE